MHSMGSSLRSNVGPSAGGGRNSLPMLTSLPLLGSRLCPLGQGQLISINLISEGSTLQGNMDLGTKGGSESELNFKKNHVFA